MINQTIFGQIGTDKVDLFTLKHNDEMEVKVMNYGATITSIRYRGKEITCGFDTLGSYLSSDYLDHYPYFGATVGRYANRISKGKYRFGEKEVSLSTNDGRNHLHGGIQGFDKKIWEILDATSHTVRMGLLSKDGEEGYPGNVQAEVAFGLTHTHKLSIEYKATTDQATPLSLTNHVYFNLSGFSEDIRSHHLKLNADYYLAKDKGDCATGQMLPCTGPMDLHEPILLAHCLPQDSLGLDNYFVINDHKAAVLQWGENKLEVFTTEPGMQVYSSGHVSPKLVRENGPRYGPQYAICFKPSRYPNGPNIQNSPGSITLPGQLYHTKTVFTFRQR